MAAPCCTSGRGTTSVTPSAGSYKAVAYMVTIKNAGAPDQQGLLQMLLRYWQAGLVPDTAFALPTVHAVIDFKWVMVPCAGMGCLLCSAPSSAPSCWAPVGHDSTCRT